MLISAVRNMKTMGLEHRAPLRPFLSFRVFGWSLLTGECRLLLFSLQDNHSDNQTFTNSRTCDGWIFLRLLYNRLLYIKSSDKWHINTVAHWIDLWSSYWSFCAHLLKAWSTHTDVHEVDLNHNFPGHLSIPHLRQAPLRYRSCSVHTYSVLIAAF